MTALLDSVCRFVNGGTPSKAEARFYDGDIPWITSADISGPVVRTARSFITEEAVAASATNRVQAGTVLLVTRTGVGKVALAGSDLCFSQDITAVIPDPKRLDVSYLIHFLRTKQDYFLGMARGATIKGISRDVVAGTEIPLLPLPEQRRIAAILDKADAVRTKRREALAQLDRLAQSIFVEMFGGDAARTCGWPEVHLANVAETLTGFAFPSSEYAEIPDAAVRLCRGANVMPGRLDWSDTAWWPRSKATAFAAFELREGDIVMAMDRPWISEGFKLARLQRSDCPSYLVQRVTRIRGTENINADYLYHLLRQPEFTRHCRPTETTVPHISPKEIRSFRFSLPPINLQSRFSERIRLLSKIGIRSNDALTECENFCAALQHRAFRGEL